MHIRLTPLATVAIAGLILAASGKSQGLRSTGSEETTAAPAANTPPASVAQTAIEVTEASKTGAAQAARVAQSAAGDEASKLGTAAPGSADALLKSLNQDLGASAKSLAASLGNNAAAKGQLNKAMESITGGNSIEALGLVGQLTAAKLTPEQMGLAKEVKNLSAAYLVQKDLGALDGAKGDVATIVNGLRKGEVTATLPAVQKVMQNASLTPAQKGLLTSVADSYAPGLKKAADQLQQGTKALQGLKGFGK